MLTGAFDRLPGRDAIAYVTARLVATGGDAVGAVALPFVVLALTRDAAAIGLVLGARTLPYLGAPLAGGLLATWSRPLTMFSCNLVRALAQALSVASVLVLHSLVLFMVLQFTVGVASALYQPAATAVVPLLFERESIGRANAFLSTAGTLIALGSAALGGLLVATIGAAQVLVVDAAGYVVAAVAVVVIWGSVKGPDGASSLRQAREVLVRGARAVGRSPWLLRLMALTFLLNAFVNGPLLVVGPALLADGAGAVAARSWGLTVAVITGGSALGSLVGIRGNLVHSGWFLAVCAASSIALPAVLGFGSPLVLVFAAAMLFGIPLGALGVLLATFIQRTYSVGEVAVIYSFVIWGSAAAAPLGSVIGAGLLRALDPTASMRVVLLAAALVTAAQVLSPRRRYGEQRLDGSPLSG